MAIAYERDDVRRRITVTIEGPFTVDDILALMDRQAAEHAWAYGLLYLTTALLADVEPVLVRRRAISQRRGRRGPVAVVVRIPEVFSVAREYAATASDGAVGFFSNRETAERWLDEQAEAESTSYSA